LDFEILNIKKAMFNYAQFDFTSQVNKSKVLKIILNVIIIISILIVLLLNINTKDDVKIISTNSRRIINTLNNYTETMSDFMVSNLEETIKDNRNDELNELKNIRLSIDYFKQNKEIEKKEQKDIQIKQEKLKLQEEEKEKKEMKKEKAMQLIKTYIPNYDNLINLKSSHLEANGYSNDFNCLKRIIRINNEELFNNLINIDYDKSEVSFNYLDKNEDYYKNRDNIIKTHLYSDYDENNNYYDYSHYIYRNYKENIIKNPIYQIIKNNLEIDYTYIKPVAPNLTEEYNNKSKYFNKNIFINNEDNNYRGWDKYYESYKNDTIYLYYKYYNQNNYQRPINYNYYFVEIINEHKIYITDPNPIEIYNKYPYKYICNIPSKITENNKPSIYTYNQNSWSFYGNWCYGRISECRYSINKNNIEEILNIDLNDYINNRNYISYGNDYTINNPNSNYYYYSNNYYNELHKNRGTRMIKHNLTNNFPEYYTVGRDWFSIKNYYYKGFTSVVFPMIFINDEYHYIKLLISGMVDIYNIPIIPPIKFI
jgi:hypothetical protein